jgi:hypothetical protein
MLAPSGHTGAMLKGKGSVDSCCAAGADAAAKLAGAFAAIKSPADVPKAERPAGAMDA